MQTCFGKTLHFFLHLITIICGLSISWLYAHLNFTILYFENLNRKKNTSFLNIVNCKFCMRTHDVTFQCVLFHLNLHVTEVINAYMYEYCTLFDSNQQRAFLNRHIFWDKPRFLFLLLIFMQRISSGIENNQYFSKTIKERN